MTFCKDRIDADDVAGCNFTGPIELLEAAIVEAEGSADRRRACLEQALIRAEELLAAVSLF